MNTPRGHISRRSAIGLLGAGFFGGTVATKYCGEIVDILSGISADTATNKPTVEQPMQLPDTVEAHVHGESQPEALSIMTSPRWKPLKGIPGNPGKLGFFLTSDDGTPLRPRQTLEFAQWLKQQNIQAHFFINGRNDASGKIFQMPSKAEYETLLQFIRQIASLGHMIHNHSWNHTSMTAVNTHQDLDAYLKGINTLQNAIREGAPNQKDHYFRYPGGQAPKKDSVQIQQAIEALFETLNLRAVQWTHDTQDWRGNKDIARTFMLANKEGGTLLMHDRNWKKVVQSITQITKD